MGASTQIAIGNMSPKGNVRPFLGTPRQREHDTRHSSPVIPTNWQLKSSWTGEKKAVLPPEVSASDEPGIPHHIARNVT